MKFAGFIGPAYKLPQVDVDCQRLVNMYAEVIESGSGKEAQVAFLKSTPGLLKLFNVGTGRHRLIYFDGLENDDGSYLQLNRIFIVNGPEVYRLEYDATSGWDIALQGTLGTTTGRVSAASSTQQYGATVFVDGSAENYVYLKTGVSTETFETFTAAGYAPVARATQVIWVDGFFIFIIKNSNTFYVSEWNSLIVSALDFASAEGSPDTIMAIIALRRQVLIFNGRTCEIFSNTGNASFPFERVEGGFIENGLLAEWSLAKIGGVVAWLGRDESGQGQVNVASGASHQRISTHAIEQAIKSYANPEDATAYTYQDGGHNFYVLNFAEATWVYDFSTKLWHERAYTGTAGLERHRSEFCVFFPNLGVHIVGDYDDSNVYQFDDETKTDNLNMITRKRTFPHVSNGKKSLFHESLKIDMKVGVGLDGAATLQGNDPQGMLKWSDDGGKTWSNEEWASLGKIGEYETEVEFRRLGMAKISRVYDFTITDPVDVVLMGAEIQVSGGVS